MMSANVEDVVFIPVVVSCEGINTSPNIEVCLVMLMLKLMLQKRKT